MSKAYVAIQRAGEKRNELKHWKYIKREKLPNGKYRYYYKYRLPKDLKELGKDIVGVDDVEAYHDLKKIDESGGWKNVENERRYDNLYRDVVRLYDQSLAGKFDDPERYVSSLIDTTYETAEAYNRGKDKATLFRNN